VVGHSSLPPFLFLLPHHPFSPTHILPVILKDAMDNSHYHSEPSTTMHSPTLSNKSSQSSITPNEPYDLSYPQHEHEPAADSQAAHPVIVPPTVSMPSMEQKPKRKRSRVTPAQLVHLEKFFACERSPSAERRKEISELLGMQERQTQIWFQNRYVIFFFVHSQSRGAARFQLTVSA
jgi:hypothetical protein